MIDPKNYVSPDGDYQHHRRACPTCGLEALETSQKLYTRAGAYHVTYLTLDCFRCGTREKMIDQVQLQQK